MDIELRNTGRAAARGEAGAEERLIVISLRAGELALEDVTLAARLGRQAAISVVGVVEPLGDARRGWQSSMLPLRELAKRRPRLLAAWLIEVGSRVGGHPLWTAPTRSGRSLAELRDWACGGNTCRGMFCPSPGSNADMRVYCGKHAKELASELADISLYQERLASAIAAGGRPDRIIEIGKAASTAAMIDYKTAKPSAPRLPDLLRPLSDSRYQLLRSVLGYFRGEARLNETLWQRNRLAELLLTPEGQEST